MYKYSGKISVEPNTSLGEISKFVKHDDVVLEFGCGEGQFAEFLHDNFNCTVYGIEINEEAMEKAKSRLYKGFCFDIEEYEWVEELKEIKFDSIIFADVLEHLKNPEKALYESAKLLKDDGKIIFSIPNIGHADILLKLLNNRFDYTEIGLLDNTHIHFWGSENLKDLCENAGLFLTNLSATIVPPQFTEQKLGSGEAAVSTQIINIINSKKYCDVYQFICAAYKKSYAINNNLIFCNSIYSDSSYKREKFGKIYFFQNNVYSENNNTRLLYHDNLIEQKRFNIPSDCTQIRFDPIEGFSCIISNLVIGSSNGILSVQSGNYSRDFNGNFYFSTSDPMFFITLPQGTSWVEINCSIIVIENIFLQNYIGFLHNSIDTAAEEKNALKNEIANTALSYEEEKSRIISDSDEKLRKAQYECEQIRVEMTDRVSALAKEKEEECEQIRAEMMDKLSMLAEEKENECEQIRSEMADKLSALAEDKENECEQIRAEMTDKLSAVAKEKRSLGEKLAIAETYKVHYFAAMDQRNSFEKELNALCHEYNNLVNSNCWKMTKPLRFVLDKLKQIKAVRMVIKGFKSLAANGFKQTWVKVKRTLSTKKNISMLVKEISSLSEEERKKQENTIFPRKIKFSILVPLYNTPLPFLDEMIASVKAQTYFDWELCLADGSDGKHNNVKQEVLKIAKNDKRIKYRKLNKNLGISENTNICIDMSTGDYLILFDHDDVLHAAALFEIMKAICEQDADFIYTDEATFESPDINKIVTAHFKPDFAPDNLRANNYICHLSAFSRELLNVAGKFRSEFDGSQDHDIILRLTANAKKIVHISKILYFWRSHPMSVSQDINSKSYAIEAGKNAVKESILHVEGNDCIVESSRAFPTIYRIKYNIVQQEKVSIIIPNKNHLEDLSRCIGSILKLSTYPNYEVVIVDNGSDDEEVFKYYKRLEEDSRFITCSLDIDFNYSKLNNYGVSKASGKYYILLNNDVEIITPEWIEEMLMYVQRDDVGAAGAMLYYPDDTIQHAGVIIGLGQHRVAGHAFHRFSRNSIGYMGRLCYAQNMSAVTAACMMVKASVYEKIGGLDEKFIVAYNDVDLCMRIREAGYLIVWTPYAEAYHYESQSRGHEDTPQKQQRLLKEANMFKERWHEQLDKGDPYYNPNLTLDSGDFSFKN